jgi:hypothetical protein
MFEVEVAADHSPRIPHSPPKRNRTGLRRKLFENLPCIDALFRFRLFPELLREFLEI